MLPGCGSAWKKPCVKIICMYRFAPRRATSSRSSAGRFQAVPAATAGCRRSCPSSARAASKARCRPCGIADRRVVAKQLGELVQVPLLAAEIELAAERAAHLGDVGRRAIGLELGKLLGELGQAAEHLQVFVDLRFDARVLHLDDDPLARLQPGAMHLADRGRGDRHEVELGEQLVERLAQLGLDDLADRLRRIGGRRRLAAASARRPGRVPTTSGRVLRSWPSLMNVGPSSVSVRRMRASRVSRAMTSPSRELRRSLTNSMFVWASQSARPYLLRTARISVQRLTLRYRMRDGADFDHAFNSIFARALPVHRPTPAAA